MDRELASSTTTRILPAWTPAVFTMPQAPGFEDWDPVGADKNYDTAGFVASCRERVEQLFLLTQAAYHLTRMRTLAGRAQEKLQGTDAVGQAAAGGTNLSPIAQPAQEKLQRNPRVEKLSERAAPMAVVPPKPVAEGAPGQRAGVGR
ncbi:hypothetical protein P3T23_009796, partial [Paraburkholderia sp. GAS448]|uniref:hypothetical protein n=1 Tax=Paraburkholderia sp. GAS448 TaxID=3035136 RepID=UPI003D1B1FB1